MKVHPALGSAFAALLLGACHREEVAAPEPAPDPRDTDLAETRSKLAANQKSLVTTLDDFTAADAALRAANQALAEKEQVIAQREVQIKKAVAEVETVKKSEAFTFSEICKQEQDGQTVIARARFQKFAADFPHSPLASHALRAVDDLAEDAAREVQEHEDRMDPNRQQRETKRLLDDGLLTLPELAPMLRGRSRNQVIGLLGRPNRVFPDGTEIGYLDRVTAAHSTRKGMLIITFEGTTVAALRMDYAGPKMVP